MRCIPKDSLFRSAYLDAVDAPVPQLMRKTGVESIDCLAGGIPTGDVTVVVGDVGSGKSTLLRLLAVSEQECTLYLPLQDGSAELAAWKLKVMEARAHNRSSSFSFVGDDEFRMWKVRESLKDKPVHMCVIDNVTPELLWDFVVQVYGDEDGRLCPISGSSGLILIDNLDMLEGCASHRSAIQKLHDLVRDSDIAVVAADDAAPNTSESNRLANAGLVIAAEKDRRNVVKLSVLRNNYEEPADIRFDPRDSGRSLD